MFLGCPARAPFNLLAQWAVLSAVTAVIGNVNGQKLLDSGLAAKTALPRTGRNPRALLADALDLHCGVQPQSHEELGLGGRPTRVAPPRPNGDVESREIQMLDHLPNSAGRVIGWDIQGFKIVIIQFDLRAFNQVEVEPGKDLANFIQGLAYRMLFSPERPSAGQGPIKSGLGPFIEHGEQSFGLLKKGFQDSLNPIGLLAHGRPDTQAELMDVLADEICRLAAAPDILRGCIQQSELPPFLP